MKKTGKNKKPKSKTLSAAVMLVLTAFFFVLAGYLYLCLKNGYTFDELIDNIVGNLIGVLAAFILFDIIYNKITQDEYAKEISQQITKTLMGDPDTLDSFNDDDKRNFLVSTIKSMVNDEDAVDMIVGNIDKYFKDTDTSRLRKYFNYVIAVTTDFPNAYINFPGVRDDMYFYVQENLNYEVKYLSDHNKNLNTNEVKIGFSFNKMDLDDGLLEISDASEFSQCIFNENLDITAEAITYLKNMTEEELSEAFQNLFTVVLKIDNQPGELSKVDLRHDGIIATYKIDYDTSNDEHSVRIIFHMPKMWESIFEITLVDPTKNPKMTFDYMPDKMDVTMYSYLNKKSESNNGAYELHNGLIDISIKDEWIYPKSGIVFNVKKILN